ncbi:MAG: ABC transporter substrate-binding protein, partial [Syntrophobacteraceae bacterium]
MRSEIGRLAARAAILMLSALLLAVSAACTDGPDRSVSTNGATGVSDNEILIGSSCALSGRAAFLGTQALHGMLSFIRQVNEEGGVHGRRIRLIALDDAYDPARCVFNTQQLIGEDRVFALTCYVGTPTTAKIIPLVEEARIPLIGLVTGAAIFQEPFRPNIINIRASYYAETDEAVRHFVEDLGIRKLAIFYQHDEYGFDGLTGTQRALNRYGLG